MMSGRCAEAGLAEVQAGPEAEAGQSGRAAVVAAGAGSGMAAEVEAGSR